MARFWTRAIRPPDPEIPNGNDPVTAAPGTVGPPNVNPGDPEGIVLEPLGPGGPGLPTIRPSAWSGWPADWATPNWGGGHVQDLTDTAWMALDLNASLLATMPPYLVDAATSLSADWLTNPDPDLYYGFEEFMKQLSWDFMLGEAFVLCTSRYATGWPARFHVVPGWYVEVDFDAGHRTYAIGKVDVTGDMLHLRYKSSVDDAHGHGPLEAGAGRLVAARVLAQYAYTLISSGGIPPSVLEHPARLNAEQAADLKAQWVNARMSSIGEPAVLTEGIQWRPTGMNPQEMALLDLEQWNESRIALMLGVPPFLLGLPSGGDSMTYSNASATFDFHWRAYLRPKAQMMMSGLSQWLVPRGTTVELNRDAYIQAEPSVRATTYATLNAIVDAQGNPVMTVDEIRQAERLDDLTSSAPQPSPSPIPQGVTG